MKYLIAVILFSIIACKGEEVVRPNLRVFQGELGSGKVWTIDEFPSEFVRSRRVDIWLPDSYDKTKKYQVLYMHDGQMLFDADSTWNKQEWKVDETLGRLISSGEIEPTIVVGIWNHPDIRWNDYFPYKAGRAGLDALKESEYKEGLEDYLKGPYHSDAYLKFIVEELKPFIDSNYSVYSDLEHTFIGGSSMGGLISMYALCEYPEVFSGAMCLSMHITGIKDLGSDNPLPHSFVEYIGSNLPKTEIHKIYFDYGTETLDASYLEFEPLLDKLGKQVGYGDRFVNLKFEGTNHSEIAWSARLSTPLTFILNP